MEYSADLQLRYNDFDGQKIINNAVIFSLLENSHLLFFEHLIGDKWNWNSVPLVLSKIRVLYLKQIKSKENIYGKISVKEVKDFYVVLKIKLTSQSDDVYAIGELKLVHFDFEKYTKVKWDEFVYKALKRYLVVFNDLN